MFASRSVHIVVTALTVLAVNASVSGAECKADTVTTNKSLFTGIAAMHFDEFGGSIAVNGRSTSTIGGELALAVCRWPAYTLSVGGDFLAESLETEYIAPGSPNFHPPLSLGFASVALTRRWRNSEIVHPMASLRVGSASAEYSYFHRINGLTETHVDGTSSASFVAPSAGAEVSLFKYMTMYGAVGVRLVGRLDTPGLNNNGLSGAFFAFGLGFGKFR